MDREQQMFLVVAGDRHRIREGITLVGSAENDRYSVIRLQNESICPKHAALRYNATTRKVHLMDLCSHGGTKLCEQNNRSARQISPLEWHELSPSSTISIGTIECRLELSVGARKSNGSSFFIDEESTDFIDCSLEEPPPQKSRLEPKKLQQSGTPSYAGSIQEPSVSSSLSTKDLSVRRDSSILVPATQQLSERCSPSFNSSVPTLINETKEEDRVVGNYADDDDLFYIPETQDCNDRTEDEKSQNIEPIGNTIGEGNREDDFLRFETEDDENTGDGIFNNPYVEQSQNLLQNINDSYKKDANTQRKSILPDRSVDSISFHGRISTANETNDDLSKIEWNESNTTKNTTADVEKVQDRSVTPELLFDQPVMEKNPILNSIISEEQREDSVTPELDFDRVTPQQLESTNKLSLKNDSVKNTAVGDDDKRLNREQSVTPDLDFDEDEADISLNQEGENNKSRNVNPYDIATQLIAVDEKPQHKDDDDPYLAPTQPMATVSHPNESDSTSVYEMQTQIAPEFTKGSPTFKVPSHSAYDLLTQKMPTEEIKQARSLRKLAVKISDLKQDKKDVSMRANKEIELDPFEIATQPFSAKKEDHVYDLQTQPLAEDDFNDLDDTVPFEQVQASSRKPDKNVYELLTQPLTARHSSGSLEDEDPEMSKNFRPPVNSTCRQSILMKQIDEQAEEEEVANISPSSNKENRVEINKRDKSSTLGEKRKISSVGKSEAKRSPDTTGHQSTVDEELDEEYCLAETMPVADNSSSKSHKTPTAKKTQSTRREKTSDSLFKKPENRTSATSTIQETPRSKPSSNADTSSFDFNTPEHPFLDVAKKEKILAVSDMIKRHTATATESVIRKNKYLFGDSSDEDNEPNEPVFQKLDSKLQMMKYEKDKEKKPKAKAAVLPEPRPNREKKRNKRYSREEEEKDKSGESTRTSGRSVKNKLQAVVENATKSSVDESVDYQPSKVKEKTTTSRKRKVAEETTSEPSSEAPKSNKSKKKDEIRHKTADEESTKSEESTDSKRSKRSKRTPATEEVVESKRSKTTRKTEKDEEKTTRKTRSKRIISISSGDDDDDAQPSSSATDVASVASSTESSDTRKSSRNNKPRLMFTKLSPDPYKRMIGRFGGLIVNMPELASILVSDKIYRTYKSLCAIARGIPVVGQPYLEAVEKCGSFAVDPWEHILEDHEVERRFKFNLKKTLIMAREARIFQDYSIIVTPSIRPPPEEVQLMVASAGGRVIKFPNQQPKHAKKMFVISDKKDTGTWPKIQEHYPKIDIISTEGFMLSIMQHYKNFHNYRLS